MLEHDNDVFIKMKKYYDFKAIPEIHKKQKEYFSNTY